jgi:phosphonate transport system substrate-binding protein
MKIFFKYTYLCFWLLGLTLAPVTSQAQDMVLAISEGTSGGLDAAQVIAKYKDLADTIGRALKTKVNVVFARDFATLEEGLKTSRYTFAMARPSDYPARAMRDNGYAYVANAKPDGQCFIVIKKNSLIKTLNEIKGKKIVLPEKVAYMTKFCTAELLKQGIDLAKEPVTYVKEQAAVGFYLDNGLADVGGVASYSGVGKGWEKKGDRILHKSVPQPYFPMVAAKQIKADQIKSIQQVLLSLSNSEQGQEVLKRMGIDGFEVTAEVKMRELPKWLGQEIR